ncbi:hypothetical protein D3C81_1736970 [compost metagenome]
MNDDQNDAEHYAYKSERSRKQHHRKPHQTGGKAGSIPRNHKGRDPCDRNDNDHRSRNDTCGRSCLAYDESANDADG